jgi:hypothetical protein
MSTAAFPDNTAPRPHLVVTPALLTPDVTAQPDDPAWRSAAATQQFTLSLGNESKGQAPLPTTAKVLWDKNYLYIRFICNATEIYAPYRKHDADLYKGDVVEVFLDAKGDGRQWIELEVSPYGSTMDQLATLTADPVSDSNLIVISDVLNRDWWVDLSWSLDGWRTAASIQKSGGKVTGWTVDMALPASSILHRLGQTAFTPMTLRANLLRYEEVPSPGSPNGRRMTSINWSPVVFGCPHISPLAMGYLELDESSGQTSQK